MVGLHPAHKHDPLRYPFPPQVRGSNPLSPLFGFFSSVLVTIPQALQTIKLIQRPRSVEADYICVAEISHEDCC